MPNLAIKHNPLIEWWPVVIGLAALYIPTLYGLYHSLWRDEDQAHGPLILLVVLYLLWQQRKHLYPDQVTQPRPWTGGLCFALALLLYVLGRSQEILIFEIGSLILILVAILLIARGWSAVRAMWFPLFFILFMMPLPGIFVDAVTLPMKMAVSYVADNVLFWMGYPIARTGVILQIGQYQLLVANACAGMHTLISLEALGLLYLNLVKHDSLFRNVTLAILIVPISFTANVIRVMVLTLVTYYFGDEAGQGFIHGFANIVLVIVALALIMSVDSVLQYHVKHRAGA